MVKAEAEIGDSILQEIISTRVPIILRSSDRNESEYKQTNRNILFDEKMAGMVHMAIGQSYFTMWWENESILHQDMIADMREEG